MMETMDSLLALMTGLDRMISSVGRSDDSCSWFLFCEFWTLWPDFEPTLGLVDKNCPLKVLS